MTIVKEISVKSMISKSQLPGIDYVINPYTGCPHACKYCYACFMKRFTGHEEPWGSFIDVKQCTTAIDLKKIAHRTVFLSSVTDCYNPLEATYKQTQHILEQIADSDADISIATKSSLILRDLPILQRIRHLTVAVSLNTLDDQFRSDMDNAASVTDRIHVLETLHAAGIRTVLFLSPIFPYITDCRKIIEQTRLFVDEYWFENLKLRGSYYPVILSYISRTYPQYQEYYDRIYTTRDPYYWKGLAKKLAAYCSQQSIAYKLFFPEKYLI
jgi:DNA repair photolyase